MFVLNIFLTVFHYRVKRICHITGESYHTNNMVKKVLKAIWNAIMSFLGASETSSKPETQSKPGVDIETIQDSLDVVEAIVDNANISKQLSDFIDDTDIYLEALKKTRKN